MKNRYNLMPRSDWDAFKGMSVDQAIHTIFAVSEYNRTCEKPLLIPAEYLEKIPDNSWRRDELPGSDVGSEFIFQPGRSRLESWSQMTSLIPNVDQMSFNGYVIAGGAALSTVIDFINYDLRRMDADFYPLYSTTALSNESERYVRTIASYDRWLDDCEKVLNTSGVEKLMVLRAEYTTTVWLQPKKKPRVPNEIGGDDTAISSYQMIHRAYRSPEEVVVGFDQPCCKAFYDGAATYLTLDCALCVQHHINPIDWRAESPTHISRALKYAGRNLRWVAPRFDFSDATAYRFAAGLLTGKDDKFELHFRQFADYVVKNQGEFPVPQHQSAYQSDYEPRFIDSLIRNGYELPTEEFPTLNSHPTNLGNLRAAATGQATYFVAYSLTFADFRANRFVVEDYSQIIERQEYRQYYLHRARMVEIMDEVGRIQNRIHSEKGKGRLAHGHMDASKPHRFDVSEATRYVELCNEAKTLSNDYFTKAIANRDMMLKRREAVEFRFDNPGAQITASFHPIKRTSHADYWGVNAFPIVYEKVAWVQIRTLLILVKRGVLPPIPRDVIKLIRSLLFEEYIKSKLKK